MNVPLHIDLSWSEVRAIALLGNEQQILAIYKGRQRDSTQHDHVAWSDHVVGAFGEFVVAKWLNVYPRLSMTPCYSGDIEGIEVRATSHRDGALILRVGDKPESVYVLVAGLPPTFTIAGWLFGREGMRDEYCRTVKGDVEPTWWIPQGSLNPPETMPRL